MGFAVKHHHHLLTGSSIFVDQVELTNADAFKLAIFLDSKVKWEFEASFCLESFCSPGHENLCYVWSFVKRRLTIVYCEQKILSCWNMILNFRRTWQFKVPASNIVQCKTYSILTHEIYEKKYGFF